MMVELRNVEAFSVVCSSVLCRDNRAEYTLAYSIAVKAPNLRSIT